MESFSPIVLPIAADNMKLLGFLWVVVLFQNGAQALLQVGNDYLLGHKSKLLSVFDLKGWIHL